MSDKDFNKKIRQKLYEHQSEYDPKAWQKMKGLLPMPWYASFLQSYGGWLWGALASTALVFTFFYQNTKNNELYEEISTLKSQIGATVTDSIFIEKTNIDTLYVTQYVDRVVEVPVFVGEESWSSTSQSFNTSDPLDKEVGDPINNNDLLISPESDLDLKNDQVKSSISNSTNPEGYNVVGESEQIAGTSTIVEEAVLVQDLVANNEVVKVDDRDVASTDKEVVNGLEEKGTVEEKVLKEKEAITQEVKEEPNEETAISDAIPTKKGKRFKLPKMRIGLTSDYMGLNVLASGINVEYFIFDKLSLNTSLIFSGLVETKHALPEDFNRKTGKNFKNQFERFNSRIPDKVKDISIQTSFVRLPIHFNYYISTWSRLKFLISVGTKLDLSVYQDIDFNSGSNSSPVRNRFEARPKPQVLNNLNYGMGIEYQYRGFVGQLMPYFDFNFRKTDYFTPSRKFGVMGSLKYEFGN